MHTPALLFDKPLFRAISLAAIVALALIFLTGCESPLEKYRTEGIRLYDGNQFNQSLAAFNKALSYDEFDPRSNTYAGLIEYRAGNYEQATYYFKLALQADPSSEQAKDGLTATLIKLNEPDQALDALERSAALAEKVNDPRWKKSNVKRPYEDQVNENLYVGKVDDRLRIGRAYENLGDYDNAAVYYKKSLDMAPHSTRTMMALAGLYEKAGNKAQTREYLIRAYNVDPATPGLTEAMTRNGVMISDVIGVPERAAGQPLVPAAH